MTSLILISAIGLLLMKLFGGRASETPWTNEGLPTPLAEPSELYMLSRRLVDAIRLAGPTHARPQILELQRRAGLVMLDPSSEVSIASGIYDARTRQATGWYGRLWQEETP